MMFFSFFSFLNVYNLFYNVLSKYVYVFYVLTCYIVLNTS